MAGPAVFTSPMPARGSVTAESPVAISVHYDDIAPLRRTWLQIDGVYVAHTVLVEPGDATAGRISTTASLADGAHTIVVQTYNSSWKLSRYSWSFTVDRSAPPVLSGAFPSASVLCDTRTPVVGASVAGQVASYEVLVDGASIPATMVDGRISAQVSDPLTNGTVHSARVTAVGTNGADVSIDWDFYVQVYPQMPDTVGNDCVACHVGYPAVHPMDDCMGCHGSGSPMGMIVDEQWYQGPEHPWTALLEVPGGCTMCHDGSYSTVPVHTGQPTHMAEADMASCDPCHTGDLLSEHYLRDDDEGATLTCVACHASGDQAVEAAIATGDDECATCHAGGASSGHEALHELDRTDECNDCHEGPDLVAVHVTGAGLECATCHDSENVNVLAALASGTLDCSGCHITQGVDYHLNMAVHYAPDSYETCGHCHHAWGSNPTRGPDVTRHEECTTCHNDTLDLEGLTTTCINCHDEEGVNYHPQTVAVHSPLDAGSLTCARCHETTNVRELHVTTGCETCHVTYGCSECHRMHNTQPGTSLLIGLSCSNCHEVQGTDYHSDFSADHTYGYMDSACQEAGCHANELVHEHETYVGDGARYPGYSDTCALCHLNEDADRMPVGATADCVSCHATQDQDTAHEGVWAPE